VDAYTSTKSLAAVLFCGEARREPNVIEEVRGKERL
jgi:hypothetical protein